uniref:RNase H type-1 domain-containing protein n=1 Tax=Oryza brachyantha TaxID=4533 RepID=J3LMX0_ORYBR
MAYVLLHRPVPLHPPPLCIIAQPPPPPRCIIAPPPPPHRYIIAQPERCIIPQPPPLPRCFITQPPAPPPRSSLSPSSRSFQPSCTMVRWNPPPLGWFKLNFDGSVYQDGSGKASIGGAIRDPDGRVVMSFGETTDHSTVGVVEARALIRGLRLAVSCCIKRLVVEGDDLVLVKLLRGEDTQTRIPGAMHEEIIGLLGCFAEVDVRHIYREGNQVAHVLCRQAYQCPGVWTGAFLSPAVAEKVDEDRRGVAHERLCKPRA